MEQGIMEQVFKNVTPQLLDRREAAAYLGLPLNRLRNLCKGGVGPTGIRISARVHMFERRELDRWKATWTIV